MILWNMLLAEKLMNNCLCLLRGISWKHIAPFIVEEFYRKSYGNYEDVSGVHVSYLSWTGIFFSQISIVSSGK